MAERGVPGFMDEAGDIHEGMTLDDIKKVADEYQGDKKTVGFKTDPTHGIYIEGRQPKAGMKEVINILYAKERWGETKKGPKGYFSERVFVPEQRIYLDMPEPSGTETIIGHVPSPQGMKSTLTRYEYADKPIIRFRLISLKDCITADIWREALTLFQEIGLGAVRSQSYGTFDVLRFGKLEPGEWDHLIIRQGVETPSEELIAAD